MRTLLVLGGTGFIGRHFVETVIQKPGLRLTLSNRGTQRSLFPDVEHILIDRDNIASCQAAFDGKSWDHVVDFSGINYSRVLHTVSTIDTDHYTFISSSAVDLASPGDPYLDMAKDKLWCENIVNKGFDSLVVRAAFVVGKYDNTDRFEARQGDWYWKGTDRVVRPAIEADFLVNAMATLALARHCGILRAGYSEETVL